MALASSGATSLDGVASVIELRSLAEVLRIAARRVVAGVEDVERDRSPESYFEGDPMRSNGSAVQLHLSVAVLIKPAAPGPASIRTTAPIGEGDESIGEGRAARNQRRPAAHNTPPFTIAPMSRNARENRSNGIPTPTIALACVGASP